MESDAELLRAARTDSGAFRALYDRYAEPHVNGGCRSLDSDGRTWQCYIGRAEVEQKIIGPGFLGEYAPSPGVG